MKYVFLVHLLFLLFIVPVTSKSQNTCNCTEVFRWVKETFEKNDAGFQYAVQQKGVDLYEKHNRLYVEKVKTVKDKFECADLLSNWLKFFRKGHLSVTALGDAGGKSVSTATWPSLPITKEQLLATATKEAGSLYAGTWKTGSYLIGITKQGKDYKGIVFESTNPAWKPQQVKLQINADNSGVYYMGDFSPLKFSKVEWIGKNAIRLASTVILERVEPVYTESDDVKLYMKEMSTDKPFIQELSAETLLFRIPSFGGAQKSFIDSMILLHDKELRNKKNLVIDIRNGTGGDDVSYENIIPYLYTNPIRVIGMEFLSTPLNNKRMEGYLSIPDLSEDNKKQVIDMLKLLNNNLGKFVNLNGGRKVSVQKMDTVMPNPQQVAIIANENNGSTDEQFLLAAKQSKKVKIFGRATFGVLDFSNMHTVKSPDGQFELGYCLSKSYRIPGMPIDNIGLQPDFFIDQTIPEEQWLKYVLSILEDKEFNP